MAVSVAEVEAMSSLSSDLFYDIPRRLDGATLASAACTCAALHSVSKEEKLWENICSMWPSTNREDVKSLISSISGFKKFYADCFPLIVNKEVPEFKWNDYLEYPEEWTEAEYYGDMDEFETISPSDFISIVDIRYKDKAPSDFISIVDIRYKDKAIYSKVLWGIPNANGVNGWFYNCLSESILITRKDGKLWQDLCNGLQLSWIVASRKIKQAANLSSWSSLGGQRHWPTENDFLIRFGSILPAKDILPCQIIECILLMKFRVVYTESDGVQTTLELTELSLQLGDMEGAHVNGRNSLLVLKGALGCCRSKNYSGALESRHLYSKVQS
ncbi:F-box protein [Camellia lanceoleosa]|uniref:F-box protein n=1 Tax=Camellia lanceoleosa TaxID=1840588 RepID=A0ACC0FSQ9_9ERIC|nr:F-box protein [Camellia lanceoleosa]